MYFVTVTYSKDFTAMILQSHSIDKFVRGKIIHHVIIQDKLIDIDTWRKALSPFYQNHELRIHQASCPQHMEGWVHQQVLKLEAANMISSESYLILDSKNFFIRPFEYSYWLPEYGNDLWFDKGLNTGIDINPFLCKIENLLGKTAPTELPHMVTPFKFKVSTVRQILKLDYINFFSNDTVPSEFALYAFFEDKPKIHNKKLLQTWYHFHDLPKSNEIYQNYMNKVYVL